MARLLTNARPAPSQLSQVLCALLTMLASAQVATVTADELVLSNGQRLYGEVDSSPDGDRSLRALRTAHATITLDRRSCETAIRESPAKSEYRRRSPTVSDTVDAQLALANWCRDNGVRDGVKLHLQRVLDLDPSNEEARARLGYQLVEGRWLTRDELLAARGMIRWEGQHRTAQEVTILKTRERTDSITLAWNKQIDRLRTDLASDNADKRREAAASLRSISDPSAAPAVARALSEERDPTLRELLVTVLSDLGGLTALHHLVQVAIHDVDADTRAVAIEHLARDNRPGIEQPFVAALRSDDPVTINNAAAALALLGDRHILRPMVDALVTTHRRRIGAESGGQTYSMNNATGQYTFGGGGPQLRVIESRNPQVLSTLVQRTGKNFEFDKQRWRAWLSSRQEQAQVDLRRDL